MLQKGQQLLNGGDFLVGDENIGVVQHGFHFFHVGRHVRRAVAAVELHAFDDIQLRFHGLAFLDGDNSVVSYLFHSGADQLAYDGVARGNACHLSDAFFIGNGLADFPELFDADVDGLVDTSFEDNGICARSHVFAAFFDYCLRQNNCGCGAVAGNVVGFGGHFLDDLRAHVFKRVVQLDLLRNGHAVIGNQRSAELLVQHGL